MFEKKAFSPSDLVNAIQTVKNSRQVGGDFAQHYGSKVGDFARNLDKSVKSSTSTGPKLDRALDAATKASGDVGRAASQIAEMNPKRIARNVTLGGLGLVGTGLLWNHLRKVKGDEPVKTASAKDFAKALAFPLAVNAGTIALTAGVNHLVNRRSNNPKKLWGNFIKRFPEFANDKAAKESFDVMVDFNPSAAKHPIVVKNFLENSVYGGEDVNVNVLSNLADIESKRSRSDSDRARGIGDAISRPLGDIAFSMKEYGNDNLKEQIERARREGYLQANKRTPIEMKALNAKILADQVRLNKDLGTPLSPTDPEFIALQERMKELEDGSFDHFNPR